MKSYVIVGQLGAQFGVYKTAKNQMPIVQFSSVQLKIQRKEILRQKFYS